MKKYVLAVFAAVAAFSLSAQTVTEEVTEVITESVVETGAGAGRCWFVSAGAGAQIFFGDHDRQLKVGDRLSPALDIAVGRWFSPSVGVRLMYSGLSARGATQTWGDHKGGVHSTGEEVAGKFTHDYGFLCKSKFNFFTLHADVMFDLTNLIGGYDERRVYGCAPYVGMGWGHVYSAPAENSFIGNVGVMNMFHVIPALDINLDIRGTVTRDGFDGEKGHRALDGILSVTAGVTYRFASR